MGAALTYYAKLQLGVVIYGVALFGWIAVLPRGEDGITRTLPMIATGYPILAAAAFLLRRPVARFVAVRSALWAIVATGAVSSIMLLFAIVDGTSGL